MAANIGDIKNSRVIIRVDFNVPLKFNKDKNIYEISDKTRIDESLKTIFELIKNNNHIIIISHLGRPITPLIENKYSLKPIFEYLQNVFKQDLYKPYLNHEDLKFFTLIQDLESYIIQSSKNIKNSKILLLENIRFFKEEEVNDLQFQKKLSELANFYINDAFSCSHREHASIMMHQLYQEKQKSLGLLCKEEIKNINIFFDHLKNKDQNLKNLAIIGGSKISTKIRLISSLIDKFDYIFIGGAMAHMILLYKNLEIGMSLKEEINDDLNLFLEKLNIDDVNSKILFPVDFACLAHDSYFENNQAKEKKIFIRDINEVQKTDIILDIGPKTISNLKNIIKESKNIMWNGPLGFFEDNDFAKGTYEIAEYISLNPNNQIYSLVGGGDSVCALNSFSIPLNNFSYISKAGGAFLEYIENNLKLVGLF
jgi:phosphoglycerate kinase